MTNSRLSLASIALAILGISALGSLSAPTAQAGARPAATASSVPHCGPYGCEPLNPYHPPKGVYRVCKWKKTGKKRWIQRTYTSPSGEKSYYRVQTVTYRTRYSNGVIHDLICALPETEQALQAPGEPYSPHPRYSK